MVVIAYLISILVLGALITENIYLFKQVSFLESQLNSYVLSAAKSQASLNYQRRNFRLYARSLQHKALSKQTIDTSMMYFPASSTWDDLYIATYNETMKSALTKLTPN